VVTDRKEGRWVYYALNPAVLEAIAEFASEAKPSLDTAWRADAGCCA
jgi:hypothetical protein